MHMCADSREGGRIWWRAGCDRLIISPKKMNLQCYLYKLHKVIIWPCHWYGTIKSYSILNTIPWGLPLMFLGIFGCWSKQSWFAVMLNNCFLKKGRRGKEKGGGLWQLLLSLPHHKGVWGTGMLKERLWNTVCIPLFFPYCSHNHLFTIIWVISEFLLKAFSWPG